GPLPIDSGRPRNTTTVAPGVPDGRCYMAPLVAARMMIVGDGRHRHEATRPGRPPRAPPAGCARPSTKPGFTYGTVSGLRSRLRRRRFRRHAWLLIPAFGILLTAAIWAAVTNRIIVERTYTLDAETRDTEGYVAVFEQHVRRVLRETDRTLSLLQSELRL